MTFRVALLAVTALALTGCGSSPKTNYYSLTPVSGQNAAAAPATPVQVAAVHVPPSLDRRSMVSRTRGQAVKVDETDQWSAPLGNMTRNVLSQDLAQRLPKDAVILPDAPTPANTADIVVDVAEFAPQPNGQVKLSGSWSLVDANTNKTLERHDVELQAPAQPGPDGMAQGMSNALGRLATQIASNVAGSAPERAASR